MSTLLTDIEAFCEANDLKEGQFGLLALNDKNFVSDLRDGRDLRMSTADKVREFMAEYRPEPKAEAA
jgi:hypothetical protein